MPSLPAAHVTAAVEECDAIPNAFGNAIANI
jgi:hypothetical protein